MNLAQGTGSILGEPEEWEKAEQKMLQRITNSRARSVAHTMAKKSKKTKECVVVVVPTFNSAIFAILAISYMKNQCSRKQEYYDHNDASAPLSRRRKNAAEVGHVRMLMILPKQDPLSWTRIRKKGAPPQIQLDRQGLQMQKRLIAQF